jgi:glycerophosphoryl diester phosphodiesterase
MLIYAHRGASSTYPENTLPAFAEAIRLGVHGVELDLHATRDGTPVVTHDASLKRTAGLDLDVTSASFQKLRLAAAAVPTFAEVLELVGSSLHLDIEVKQAGIEEHVLRVLSEFPDARWAISSFDWNVLDRFRDLDRDCELWLLTSFPGDDLIQRASRIGGTTAALDNRTINEQMIAKMHDAGLKVMAWTVNDADRAEQLRSWGLDMLCTDTPEQFVS